MKVEISLLVNLIEQHYHYQDRFREQIDLGNQISIKSLSVSDWYEKALDKIQTSNDESYKRFLARKMLDNDMYTHRYCALVDKVTSLNDPKISQARDWLSRAIVLTKIVHPLGLPIHPPTIFKIVSDTEEVEYKVIPEWTHSQACYVGLKHPGSLGLERASSIANLWQPLQTIYSKQNDYKRIIRALWYYNEASHIRSLEVSHLVRHAALESLICVGGAQNRQQIVQRLPKLVDRISPQQASDIYALCVDIKHNAAPALLYSLNSNDLDHRDNSRVEAASNLDLAVRSLFEKALQDVSFADLLANPKLLEQEHPVNKKMKKT